MKEIVSEYFWPVLLAIFSATLLKIVLAFSPIPPDVEKASGVKTPLSTSSIRALLARFYYSSWWLYILGIVFRFLLEGA